MGMGLAFSLVVGSGAAPCFGEMGAEVERGEALWTFGRESRRNPFGAGAEGRQIPAFASKHAEIEVKLDIPSNLGTILLEPTQRWLLSRGWRQTVVASQLPTNREGRAMLKGRIH
jgi:hypothetical protein